ncbi:MULTISPECIES: hypothetical protein [unclassified Flavobacterium]|uniref:hypothetical protein n=1 Tax=unclassified Flavobacterium TaxID=196869 RepID=UPI001F142EA3|nr:MULTISPECIES: hypothetical protein [unclassified Flavobacterium]UMY66631.1 hypothetical protein MKO97_04395 [Flavobacterium sp. HJ-32-4]
MRKLYSTLFLFIVSFSFAQLNGTYVIGTGQTYTTLSAAIAAVNANGLSGNVTLLLDQNQSYTGSLTINRNDLSSTKTLTIKPNTGKTITVTASSANNFTGVGGALIISGSDYVTIDGSNTTNGTTKDLTWVNNYTPDYTDEAVIAICNNGSNGATNITVKNTILKFNAKNQEGELLAGIFCGGSGISDSSTAGAVNSNLTFSNNDFQMVRQGVMVLGSSSNKTSTVSITNSTFGSSTNANAPSRVIYASHTNSLTVSGNTINGVYNGSTVTSHLSGIELSNVATFTVSGNTIRNLAITHSGNSVNAAISVSNTSTSGTISGNTITAVSRSSGGTINGILLASSSSSASIQCVNNMVSDVYTQGNNSDTSGAACVRITSGAGYSLYFNSLLQNASDSGNGSQLVTAALHIAISTSNALNIQNNILGITGSNGKRYAIYVTGGSGIFTNINYNNYTVVSGSGLIGYLSSDRSSLAAWKTATGKDANSINASVSFTSSSDLHLTAGGSVEGAGIAISGITTDIDGDSRASSPTIGADERKCSGGTTTWSGTAWSNGAPTGSDATPSTVKAVINGNYAGNSFRACELTVNSGKTLTINTGKNIVVEYNIAINGSLVIESGGSLTQVNDASSALGTVTTKRTTTALKQYDFTYWSSPITSATLANTVNNGDADFYRFDGATYSWVGVTANTTMTPGTGYISRAPSNLTYPLAGGYTASFTGTPNNGTVSVSATKTASGPENLVGNPYPSALDADAFIKANIYNPNAWGFTGTINQSIDGNLYFWTHNTAISATTPGSFVYNYTTDDYATYNLSGGTSAGTGGTAPTRYIASGQGFFVGLAGTNGAKTVTFNNSMRQRTESNNGQFFRTQGTATTSTPSSDEPEKHRIWLNLTNSEGAFKQMLLAYVDGATDNYDYGFDGAPLDGGNYVSLYSILDSQKLVIQGRDVNIDESEVIPLGYSSTIEGEFQIAIDHVDGLFAGDQHVYLVDKAQNNLYVDLKAGPYTFTTNIGTFDDRFEIRYANPNLGIDEPQTASLYAQGITGGFEIATPNGAIASVVLYDTLGREVFSAGNISANRFRTESLNFHAQIGILKIKMEDGTETTRKLIIR